MMNRYRKSKRPLNIESLESRRLFARDTVFASVGSLTVSMAPDGTPVGQQDSRLYQGLSSLGTTAQWQAALAEAFQKWAIQSNINFGLVDDSGVASGVYGPTRGDERFGDIRISGFDFSTDTFAEAVSEQTRAVGTWAGDIVFNTHAAWGTLTNIEAAALHEVGHVLGLEHSTNANSVMHAHGGNGITDLIAEDIAKLQSIYGTRQSDPNEGDHGNNTIGRASPIRGADDDLTVAEGFNGSQVWIQFGDLTTASDVDIYELRTALGYSGPMSVRVQTSGISLAKIRGAIVDRNGTVITEGSIDGLWGGTLTLDMAQTNPGSKYYLRIEKGSSDFWSIGDYAITIASPSRWTADGDAIASWAQMAHRWYFDSDRSKNGYSWQLLPQKNDQPDLDTDNGTDDTFGGARRLDPVLTVADRIVYRWIGSMGDLTDTDHIRLRSPANWNGPMEMKVDIESLKVGGLVPEAEILDSQGNVVASRVRVRSYGQFQIVFDAPQFQTDYVIRIKGESVADTFRLGNFSVQITFSSPTPTADVTFESQLAPADRIVEREWFVARPQLFSLSLEGLSDQPRTGEIWVSIFNENKKYLAGLVAPLDALRTSPGLLLDPGTYFLQIAYASEATDTASVPFRLMIDSSSDPIGPLLGTPGVQPKFLCPGETNIYCYPGSTTPTSQTTAIGGEPVAPLPAPSSPAVLSARDGWFWNNNYLPTNPTIAVDTNGDNIVSPIDALLVLNRLNRVGSTPFPSPPEYVGYLDTSNDGMITPLDALLVINTLNLRQSS